MAIREVVREDGLVGVLFRPAGTGVRPGVLVLGGSEGGLPEGSAAALAEQGFVALALAYFGNGLLPRELVEIPLEYFAGAIRLLRSRREVSPERIAVLGGSKGGELALLLGATYPEDVGAVVGYVPSSIVYQGISFEPWYSGSRSSWTLGGEPLPFVDGWFRPSELVDWRTYPLPVWPFFGLLPLPNYPFSLVRSYERPLGEDGAAVSAATIPVERIRGPVMLISGAKDRMWPSARLSEMAIERLGRHEHPFYYEHLCYEDAGHMIFPYVYDRLRLPPFLDPGGTGKADRAANADSWPRVLRFLEQYFV